MRILLVEDEPGLRVTLSDLLTAEGYDIETARDGEDGLAAAASGNFDLVMLDVMLPKRPVSMSAASSDKKESIPRFSC